MRGVYGQDPDGDKICIYREDGLTVIRNGNAYRWTYELRLRTWMTNDRPLIYRRTSLADIHVS